MDKSLSTAYYKACHTPSDINEHLPTLRHFSSRCSLVVEMGVRSGVSTLALLHGHPHMYTGIDINPAPVELERYAQQAGVLYKHRQADTTEIEPIPYTDLLFIDTLHTYAQLKRELYLHGGSVASVIILHDTCTYGFRDEGCGGNGVGLMPAVTNWLHDNPDWVIATHHKNNNGLLILVNKKRRLPL